MIQAYLFKIEPEAIIQKQLSNIYLTSMNKLCTIIYNENIVKTWNICLNKL